MQTIYVQIVQIRECIRSYQFHFDFVIIVDEKGSPIMSPASKNKGPTESLGFMNALSSQVHPQKVRKVKKVVRTLPNTKVARQSRLSSEDDPEHKPMDE